MTPDTKSQDSLRDLLQEQFVDLLNNNFATVHEALTTAEDGKAGFGVSFKMCLVRGMAYSIAKIGGSKKWDDTAEGNVKLFEPDQDQEKMDLSESAKEFVRNVKKTVGKGGSCTISSGGKSVTIEGKEKE